MTGFVSTTVPTASIVTTIGDWITEVTDWLSDVSANTWFLAVIVVIALLDAVIPIVPSETTVIIGGVAASSAGEASYPLWAVIVCGAVGAFLGDNLAYSIGRRAAHWFERRAERRPKTRARLDWAAAQIRKRGGGLLITARFIPAGRTALTLSCGITRQPRLWFMAWIALATTLWASYAALLGYLGGATFEDNHTAAFLLAFGVAIALTVLTEVIRSRRAKHRLETAQPVPDEIR